ncbi:MAG: 3-methyl-2-oxobutanoate dehydrogenase subunit VorB [Atribacterota bacterium]
MEKILMKGNEALAEAAVRAGCRMYFGYPITPQTEISEYLSLRLPQVGGVFLQAETEVAAINMVYGASATGMRVMTSSSGPGISLKQEGLSALAIAELPCVVVNMVRGGPGVGNIQPAQSDYFQAVKGGGHGDYKVIVLAPSSVQELVDFTYRAFYLADKYCNPVIILGDGMLAQMMEPVIFAEPDFPPLPPKDWIIQGKGRGERKFIVCFALDPQKLEELNLKLQRKYRLMEEQETDFEVLGEDDAELLLVGFGTVGRILKTVVREGKKEGIKCALFRPITLFPFPYGQLKEEARRVGRVLVVEMNLGQMVEDVRLAVEGIVPVFFHGRTGGMIPKVEEILEKARQILRNEVYHESRF